VIDRRTNGPEPFAVFHTVSVDAIATVVAAPQGPKRTRRREVGNEQVACDDPGPEAGSPDHERGDADADRRP